MTHSGYSFRVGIVDAFNDLSLEPLLEWAPASCSFGLHYNCSSLSNDDLLAEKPNEKTYGHNRVGRDCHRVHFVCTKYGFLSISAGRFAE
jgi:hypothetical protein